MFPEGRILDFLIVGVIALIVVGPKDLPILMRRVGQFLAHMRGMAAEFRASFDELARQSELDELRKEVEALRSGRPLATAVGLGEEAGVQQVFDDIHAGLRAGEGQLHPLMSHQHTMPTTATPMEGPLSPEAAMTPLPPANIEAAAPAATPSAGPPAEALAAQSDGSADRS